MAEIVRMPKMSDTMTEGVIAKWHKKVGDTVKSGELMAEIETDKATMDYESFNEGVVLHLGAKEGEAVQVNDVLAVVGKKGEDFKELLASSSQTETASEGGKTETSQDKDTAVAEPIDTSKIKAEIVRMPKMSDTMTDGVIAAWHKKVGDTVKSGELMAEVETDKATMEYESYNSGTVLYLGAKEKDAIPVDGVLAIVGEKDADWKTLLKASEQEAPKEEASASKPAAASAPAPTSNSSSSTSSSSSSSS
ncbi:MAG: biotin/lipoyl-containing protein, partial [Cyclobacteriaceae bacterium]